MGVIRFLGQHKGAVALVMLLLLLKAGCELAIPVLTSQIVDVGIAQSGVEDLDVLAGYKAAGVDLFPIQMAYLLRIGGLMLLAAAGSMVLDVAAGFVSAHTGAKIGAICAGLFARVVAFSDAEINRFSAAVTRAAPTMSPSSRTCAPWDAWCSTSSPSAAWSWSWSPTRGMDRRARRGRGLYGHRRAVPFHAARFKIMQTLIDRVNLVAREC
ncbi:MAG: hypothetical protein ACLSDQ_09150 [Adlercreutzia equolifaciens]